MRGYGYCECGCGMMMRMGRNGLNRFITGHNARGATHPMWKGGRTLSLGGYVRIKAPGHPRSCRGYVMEHILIAEQALGKPLPDGAVLHHVNEDRGDNRPENLVICEGRAYHNLLHRRMRAQKACGNPNWRRCTFCKEWDDPENMFVPKIRAPAYHRECSNLYRRERRVPRPMKTKLNLALANEIRRRVSLGETDQSVLAKEYGVTPSTISRVVNNHVWKGGAE